MVFATARRVTRDASLAEDVSQETFLELARKGRSITESVGAWLHRVAWRRACDAVRAEVTRQRYETAAMALTEGRECTWEELEPAFDEALADLPQEERSVIIEHYLEGRTQTDIAGRLGLSQSSVSRLLEQSITHLRAKLKAKGLLCGAALGAIISAASASQAAPASLMAALNKIALSSIGSTASTAAGGTFFATLLGLNLKVVIAAAAVLLACAVGYDIASKDSRLAHWFEPQRNTAAKAEIKPVTVSHSVLEINKAATKARLVAEAKAIWARNAKKFSKEEIQGLFGLIMRERDPDKRFAAMNEVGINISRVAYDGVVARHPDVLLFDERKSGHALGKLWNDILRTWATESPLASVAWASRTDEFVGGWFQPSLAPWVRSHPDAWAAFVEAGPDQSLGDYARLWVEDLDDPGSIWAKIKTAGVDGKYIEGGIFQLIQGGAPADDLYRLIMRCPNAKVRSESIIGICARLRSEQLIEAANSGLLSDQGMVATLRAMAGDTTASFDEAAAWINKAANGGGYEGQLARWMELSAHRFYAQWLKVDPQAALRHSARADNGILLDQFMQEGRLHRRSMKR